jgi:hypothetical protein
MGKGLSHAAWIEVQSILTKYQFTNYPSIHSCRQLGAVDADIARCESNLRSKQFNAKDYPTTAELTAVYEAITSEIIQR